MPTTPALPPRGLPARAVVAAALRRLRARAVRAALSGAHSDWADVSGKPLTHLIRRDHGHDARRSPRRFAC